MVNLANTIKNILVSVGKNNKPTYAVMAVATANGIFKPISSLTDKKEKPEARKYAALREFITEVVAVPTYWACGVGAGKIGEKLFKDNPEKKNIAKANMMFLGVCTAALFVIPAVCSLVLKGLDKIVKKNPKQKLTEKEEIIPDTTKFTQKNLTQFGNIYSQRIYTFANRGGLKI